MQLYGICHFYNEEYLLPHFITHHYNMFDEMIMIDHHSTDNSCEIIKDLAPDSWSIVKSRLNEFDAVATDVEVMDWESTFPEGAWRQALNVTEFVWTPNYRERLETLEQENPGIQAFAMRSFCLVDRDLDLPELSPLYKNHTWGMLDRYFGSNVPRHHRFVHKAQRGNYSPGRHSVELPNKFIEGLYLLHWTFAPWSQALERKMQIQNRIPHSNKMLGQGVQHLQTYDSMNVTYNNWLAQSGDLLLDPGFKAGYDFYTNQELY